MSFFLDSCIVELGDLSSSVSRLLTACLGSKRASRILELDQHDQFLLDNAIALVEDVLKGLHFLAAREVVSPGPEKITLFNCVVQAVLNKPLDRTNGLRTVKDLQTYFEAIESILKKTRVSGPGSVTERQTALARRFFFELANTLPFEQHEDGTRLTISMEEVLLRELKRAAQEEGIPVHKLVSEIILSHLGSNKAAAKAG
jgi:predicted DNA binding CopG/RHH family protein